MFKNLIGQKVSGFKERMGEPGKRESFKGDSIRGIDLQLVFFSIPPRLEVLPLMAPSFQYLSYLDLSQSADMH